MSETPKDKIMMTQSSESQVISASVKTKRRRRCFVVTGALVSLLLLLIIVALILALIVFKQKEPRITILSATLEGVSPRLSFPAIQIQLNLTVDLEILLENRDSVSFKHGHGKSLLLYQGKEVGDTDIYPGVIPAKASSRLRCRLTLQVDRLASNLTGLIGDVMAGQLSMETFTSIPGKVTFLGVFKKHVVALSRCQFTFGISDMQIRNQVCKNKAKL